MIATHPRFDEPNYTVDASTLFASIAIDLDDRPLPTLADRDDLPVEEPIDEPMVAIEHRRIRVLANYWHAGWSTAVPTTTIRATAFAHLVEAVESLPPRWGFAVFDAWRPFELQRELFDAAADLPELQPGFMAHPSRDSKAPSPHLTGGAVDLTLTFGGTPIAPGTGFDDTSERARAAHLEDEPGPDRHIRRALFHAMCDQGFVGYVGEWWHFEYGTRRWAAITDRAPIYGPTEA